MTEPTPEQIEAAYSAFMRSNAGDRSAIKDAITAAQRAAPPVMTEPTPEQIEAGADLRKALEQCAQWFEQYGKSHEAKGATEKAARNFYRAGYARAYLTAALAARPVPDGWQLISSAPKDGQWLILSRWSWLPDTSGLKPGTKEWRERIFDYDAPRTFQMWWACRGRWSDKWRNWNDGVEPSGLNNPTHWMPEPAAPTPSKAEGE